MTKREPIKDPDIDYIDKLKAIGMSDKSIPDVTFTYADYQCLERLMNVRDVSVEDDLKRFIKQVYIQDNRRTVKIVTSSVCKQVAETIAPMLGKLEDLEEGQAKILELLDKMDKRMKVIEEQVFITDEQRLQNLERYSSWGYTVFRASVYIVIAAALALALAFQFHYKMR